MLLKQLSRIILAILLFTLTLIQAQEKKIYPGADEKSPSRSQYFSWINNSNEGTTEKQTLINLEFFKWLHQEYGMKLDIYAFDAGAIDGKRFYGSIYSERFKSQFPRGFGPIKDKADKIGTRLGVWGGPDGFGSTPETAKARIDQMVKLCRDYNFALFKFDAVCGPLPESNEKYFTEMMEKCRSYSPDLILLNHRLGLKKAEAYATTFLWEGAETYTDVFSTNNTTAPHHRAGALNRGLVPGLKRLTEDHGVCLSSCLDYWEDELILQAFNRNLILSPQIYGNPWFLKDEDYPKLARIFNLHRKYKEILVEGMILPESKYGKFAVARGDGNTRIITLRNTEWNEKEFTLRLNDEIGLKKNDKIEVRQFHPYEKMMGSYKFNDSIVVKVLPFRSCLIVVSSDKIDEPGVKGSNYEIVRNVPGKPVKINLLGFPGEEKRISINNLSGKKVFLEDKLCQELTDNKSFNIKFPGEKKSNVYHKKLGDMKVSEMPDDAEALYEATIYAADNNALEIRALKKSGRSNIKVVRDARDAFINQSVFKERGIWDKNLFDGDMETSFFPSRKYMRNVKVNHGCFRIDLGKTTQIDELVLKVNDEYSLQPLLRDEGNHAEISTDLVNWKTITYLAGKENRIKINGEARYIRLKYYPDRVSEIEGYRNGEMVDRSNWRASNLFSHPSRMKFHKAWYKDVMVDDVKKDAYLCVAVNGKHGNEGAYAAVKINGKYIGAPDRSVSYPSNTWEYVVRQTDANYTYYFPLTEEMKNQKIEVYLLGMNPEFTDIKPEIWLSSYPIPFVKKELTIR